MPKAMECPYFVWEDKLVLHCEMAVQTFPDKKCRDDWVNALCANIQGCKQCPLCRTLDDFYERTGKEFEKH